MACGHVVVVVVVVECERFRVFVVYLFVCFGEWHQNQTMRRARWRPTRSCARCFGFFHLFSAFSFVLFFAFFFMFFVWHADIGSKMHEEGAQRRRRPTPLDSNWAALPL